MHAKLLLVMLLLHHHHPETDNVKPICLEGVPESINFNFSLRVVGFSLIPSNRTKSAWVVLVVCPKLLESEAHGNTGGVDCQDNTLVGMINYWPKVWGCNDCLLQILHGSFLFWAPDK